MPLIDRPTFKITPPAIAMFRGRKPASILDILDQTPTGHANSKADRNFDVPKDMTDEQMLAYYKLCLHNYAFISEKKEFNHKMGRHHSYIATTRIRREVGRYTGALLEGMVRSCFFLL